MTSINHDIISFFISIKFIFLKKNFIQLNFIDFGGKNIILLCKIFGEDSDTPKQSFNDQ